jgi:hypothetical protein
VERDTPCTSALLAAEMDTPNRSSLGYTLHVYTAGAVDRYTLHVHTAIDGKKYTLHVYSSGGGMLKQPHCMRWKQIHPHVPTVDYINNSVIYMYYVVKSSYTVIAIEHFSKHKV